MTKIMKNTMGSSSNKDNKKDYGAELLGKHHSLKAEFIGSSNEVRFRVVDQSTLDKLLMNDSISLDQYKCLDNLYSDFHKAGLIGVKASNYNPRINSSYEARGEAEVILRRKVSNCLSAIKSSGGIRSYDILIKLLHDRSLVEQDLKWISVLGNFNLICEPTEKFYETWGIS
jgi:hypothetical protein